jgi:hypothetical protein
MAQNLQPEAHCARSNATAFLEVSGDKRTLRLSLKRAFAEHLGLRLRATEALRHLLHALTRMGIEHSVDVSGDLVTIDTDARSSVSCLLPEIDLALKRTAERPLTPRLVQAALGITSQERLRWTKDGRLRRYGSQSFRKGQRITLSTYAVEEVARLVAEPAVIAGWRVEDVLDTQKK